jgi:demethylmenaquinone methyltransferase / 2-methoxy-6-polyprenyl-1,4-benzoquinol methylase
MVGQVSATPFLGPRARHARGLFAGVPATYDLMSALLSFGQDGRWRRFMVSRVAAHHGGLVLDVATGTGAVARDIVRRTRARVVGLDQSEPMLREGVRRLARANLSSRVPLLAGHGERLPFPDGTFDAVTFTYLLRYVEDPAETLAELARVVRPGGIVANLEFHVPAGPWQWLWLLYTRGVMPVIGWAVSPGWKQAGRFLGPSISAFYRRLPLEEQLDMWKSAGVSDVRTRVMSLGGGVVIWGTRDGR